MINKVQFPCFKFFEDDSVPTSKLKMAFAIQVASARLKLEHFGSDRNIKSGLSLVRINPNPLTLLFSCYLNTCSDAKELDFEYGLVLTASENAYIPFVLLNPAFMRIMASIFVYLFQDFCCVEVHGF
jgi:hypothetical protein